MFVIMLTVSLTLAFSALLLAINEWRTFGTIGKYSIQTVAELVGRNSTATLAFQDKKAAKDILSALSSEPEILLGCLYAKHGELFASYSSNGSSLMCPSSVPAVGHVFGSGTMAYTSPIYYENDVLGSFYILSDMHIFRHILKMSALALMGVILSAAVFAYLIAARLQRVVTKPVLKLADTAKLISREKRYDVRANASDIQEIDTLVTAFNRMLDVVQWNTKMLRKSEEQFKATFDVAAVGKALIAPSRKYVRVNSAFCRMLGYTQEELIQRTVSDITFPEDRAETDEVIAQMMEGKIGSYVQEKRYINKRGKPLWTIVSAAPIRDESGNVVTFISVIQDISERKKAEQERDALLAREHEARLEAERSTRMRDDFLSIASHELRTPITPIRLHMQIMKQKMRSLNPDLIPGYDGLMKAFDISEHELDDLSRLIEDLLDVTRITAKRLTLNRRETDLIVIVNEALDLLRPELSKSGCSVTFHSPQKVVGIWDSDRIKQIVINLLTNAAKYGRGKPIEITALIDDGRAKLLVRDHGIGISKENQKKIFNRFERVAPISHYAGLGLGLFISRELAISHEGDILVESELGVGSTFTLALPLGMPSLTSSPAIGFDKAH
jgi:PAS domain S-box-containing protein